MDDEIYNGILKGLKAVSEGEDAEAYDAFNSVLDMITEGKIEDHKTEVKYMTIVTIEIAKLLLRSLSIGTALKYLLNVRKIILDMILLETKGVYMKEKYEELQKTENYKDEEAEEFLKNFSEQNLKLYLSLYMFTSIYLLEGILHTKEYEEICNIKKDIEEFRNRIGDDYLFSTDDFLPYTTGMIEDMLAHYEELKEDAEKACERIKEIKQKEKKN